MRSSIVIIAAVFVLSLSTVLTRAADQREFGAVGPKLAKPTTLPKKYLNEFLKYYGKDQFNIEVKIIHSKDKKEKILLAPRITVFEGQEATISDIVQRPFVTGVQETLKGIKMQQPIIHVHSAGTDIKLKVENLIKGLENFANIDLSVEQSAPPKVSVKQIVTSTDLSNSGKLNLQSAITKSTKTRITQTVELGKTVEITLSESADKRESRKLKLTIRKIPSLSAKKSDQSKIKR